MTKQERCQGRTRDGEPCRSFALPGTRFCLSHSPDRVDELRAARAKGGTNASKLRKLAGRRRRLDSMPELVTFTAQVIQDLLREEDPLPPDVGRCALYGISILRQLLEAGDLEKRVAALEKAMNEGGSNKLRRLV